MHVAPILEQHALVMHTIKFFQLLKAFVDAPLYKSTIHQKSETINFLESYSILKVFFQTY